MLTPVFENKPYNKANYLGELDDENLITNFIIYIES